MVIVYREWKFLSIIQVFLHLNKSKSILFIFTHFVKQRYKFEGNNLIYLQKFKILTFLKDKLKRYINFDFANERQEEMQNATCVYAYLRDFINLTTRVVSQDV